MKKQVLFIQGAGEGAYKEDKKLADNLQQLLGSNYQVHFPRMKDEENAEYQTWADQIKKELDTLDGDLILVGHSVGASVLIKFISEREADNNVAGAFLLATPFWGGDEGWKYEGYETLMLPPKPKSKLSEKLPLHFYHAVDDEVVPFQHLSLFNSEFPKAKIREIGSGGHQLNNDLTAVASDIKAIG